MEYPDPTLPADPVNPAGEDVFSKLNRQQEEQRALDELAKNALEERDFEAIRKNMGIAGPLRTDLLLAEPLTPRDASGHPRPVCLCKKSDIPDEERALHLETLKAYFPDVEMREMQTANGETAIVVIGVDAATLNATIKLEKERVRSRSAVEETKASIDRMLDVDGCHPSAKVTAQAESVNLPAPVIAEVKAAGIAAQLGAMAAGTAQIAQSAPPAKSEPLQRSR